MNTMAYTNTYGFDQSYDPERQAYYEPSIYQSDVSMFTQQELGGFDQIARMCGGEAVDIGAVDMGMAMGCWSHQQQQEVKPVGFGDASQQFFGHEPNSFDMDMSMGYPDMDLYQQSAGCFQEQTVGSCQASPFVDQSRLPFQASFHQQQQPVSPITPAGSPLQYLLNAAAPPAYILLPVENNGQLQYSAYQVPMESYLAQPSYQISQGPFESQHTSPNSVPSLIASPLTREAEEEEDEEEEDEGEEEDDENDDQSVLPNCGNTELRGMGLYDDTPDLMFCPSPAGCSPITPHDQLRPTIGKGLVLEQSFGLPEKMMMKDEESGEIVEGKLEIDEDEPW